MRNLTIILKDTRNRECRKFGIKNGFTWEDSFNQEGFYITTTSKIQPCYNQRKEQHCKNIFKTESQAKSALAFAQLTHIVHKYNEGINEVFNMFHIVNDGGILKVHYNQRMISLLPFYSQHDAETSLEVNRELWEQYWMIKK